MTAPPELDDAAELIVRAQLIIEGGLRELRDRGGVDENETLAYDLAHAASALATARSCLSYSARGDVESWLVAAFLAQVLADLAAKVLAHEAGWHVEPRWYDAFRPFVATYRDPSFLAGLAESPGPRHLGEDFDAVARTFHRFAEERVRPHAERVHRTNADVPESIIKGLAELGGFGLSIPEEFGGFSTGGESEYVGMVVATEELSWGSLGIGGSLITRPEIMTRALLNGGTKDQQRAWLPRLASGETLCAIAVTEPDFGSDVAGVTTSATPTEGGWLVSGAKTWCTFAGRADVLVVLARTDPDRALAHRGLSLLLVEKPVGEGHSFVFRQEAAHDGRRDPDGRLEGRAIDTIGYRGMHSYEVSFDNWFVPQDNLVGGEEGLGRGFYFQMAGFENGRLQTAARAVGLMQAAYDDALEYARHRVVFGRALIDFELTRTKLATMAAIIQCSRQYALEVARRMTSSATLEAAMAKAHVCRAAEWVTREAMQIHGGMGYAEEYPVSRYFLDARVLSIFEGADETLCLKVIARRLLDDLA